MGAVFFIISLLLIQAVYSQIDTPEDARRVACSLAIGGLTGDPQCALSTARLNLAGQGINQAIAIDDLNELCTLTPCAQLIDLQLETFCEDGSESFSFRQRQLQTLSCTVDNTTRSCVEFISSPQFQTLNMSIFMPESSCGMSNITEGMMCLPECAMMLEAFFNTAGCCAQRILDYFEAIGLYPDTDLAVSVCGRGIGNIPDNCRRYEQLRSSSYATKGSVGILSLIIAAVIALN